MAEETQGAPRGRIGQHQRRAGGEGCRARRAGNRIGAEMRTEVDDSGAVPARRQRLKRRNGEELEAVLC